MPPAPDAQHRPPLKLFISYAHADSLLLDEVTTHLKTLEQRGVIKSWFDGQISAGTEWEAAILAELEAADIILLLVSPRFMASWFIQEQELTRALARHEDGSARVIPILLQPTSDLDNAPFAKLQMLPHDSKRQLKPVALWRNRHQAYTKIVKGIAEAAEELWAECKSPSTQPEPPASAQRIAQIVGLTSTTETLKLTPLALLEQDLGDLACTLEQIPCGFTLSEPLLGDAATTKDARRTFRRLAGEQTTLLLVLISGYLWPVSRAGAADDVYLVTADFDPAEAADEPELYISIRWLRDKLVQPIEAGGVLMIIDGCLPDAAQGSMTLAALQERIAATFDAAQLADGTAARFVVIATGARPDQPEAHTVIRALSAALSGQAAAALDEQGRLTIERLVRYLHAQLPDLPPVLLAGAAANSLVLATYDRPPTPQDLPQPRPQDGEATKRRERLQSLILDHSGFMRNRLASFVGRADELVEIRRRIAAQLPHGGYVTITGQAGQGKSSMIATLIAGDGRDAVAHHFIPLSPGPDHQVSLLRDIMARLILKHNLSDLYVASESRPALRDYLVKVLNEITATGAQEVIYIDGLDQLEEDLSGVRDLSFLPTNPPAGIVFVLGTRPNDTLKPLDLLKPHYEYRLPNVSRAGFDLMLQNRGVTLDPALADRFYTAMQQNALYLDLVAKELASDAAVDPETIIRQIADNPNNLFSVTMDRLKRQAQRWREVIKPILGVLLATRAPLSARAIRALVGVDDELTRDGLQWLGGLVAIDGSGRYSLYHLKLRDFLRQDEQQPDKPYIFATDEEQGWHQRFADWCAHGTAGIAGIWQPAPHAAEQERRSYARQHYIAHLYRAQAWDALWQALDEGGYGQAKIRHDPSTRSYAQDLDLGRLAASRGEWGLEAGMAHLDHLWRYTLLRCSLASQADNYPKGLFPLLVLVGRGQEAIDLAEMLTDAGHKAEVLAQIGITLIQQPGREHDGDQVIVRATEVARGIGDAWHRATALSQVAQALAQAQHFDHAELLLNQAAQAAHCIDHARLRAQALSQVAQALAQAHRFDHAEALARSIDNDIQRTLALRAVAGALAQAHLYDRAEALINQAAPTARSIDESDQGSHPLRQVIEALAHPHEWDQAEALIDQADQVTHSIEDGWQRSLALRAAAQAQAQAQAHQWDRAEALALAIGDPHLRAHALRVIVQALALAHLYDRAETLARSIDHTLHHVNAFSEVGYGYQGYHAEVIIDQATQTARSIGFDNQRAHALSAVVRALAQAHQWDRAEALTYAIDDAHLRGYALSEVAEALAQAHLYDQAEVIIDQATHIARSIDSNSQRAHALSAVAGALAQAHLYDRAETLARSIDDPHLRTYGLRVIAQALAQGQHFDRAEALARSIDDTHLRIQALSAVAQALAQAHQWDRAEALACSIDDAHLRTQVLSAVAQALAQAHQWDRAEALIDRAEALARSIDSASQRTHALSAVAQALAQAHQWDRAEALAHFIGTWQHAEIISEVAESLTQTYQRDRTEALAHFIGIWQYAKTLHALAEALAHAHQWERAEVLARSIDDAHLRVHALSAVAEALAQAHLYDRAEALIDQAAHIARSLDVTLLRDQAFRAVAKALAQAHLYDRAEALACSIDDTDQRVQALHGIAQCLTDSPERLLALIQRSWREADTREYTLELIPLAAPLIVARPEVADVILDGMEWVDAFLKR